MIVFLNFAPISFMGGAEKWILDIASKVNEKEETIIIDVHRSISNIYGVLILKNKFRNNIKNSSKNNSVKILSLKLTHFLPLTKEWWEVRKILSNSRLIYMKCDIAEIIIALYFIGTSSFKKLITGVHSPFLYSEPLSFSDHFHNLLYKSSVFKQFLTQLRTVHVLNLRDRKILQKDFSLSNVVLVQSGIKKSKILRPTDSTKDKKTLQVLFVGLLSLRKGVDTLIEIIINSPDEFVFHIAGSGPMQRSLDKVLDRGNVRYYGQLDENALKLLYNKSDVFLLPSRAETLSLALLESMSYGLPHIVSSSIALGFPNYLEYVIKSRKYLDYIKKLNEILNKKRTNKIPNYKIIKYFNENLSFDVTYPLFFEKIL